MFEEFFVAYGSDVVGGALFFGAAWVVAIVLSKTFKYVLGKRLNLDPSAVALLAHVISISIVVLAGIAVLEDIGVEISSLIAALGIFGFAIAIGMRTTTTNFFSGVMILILKPYKVGEYIDGERVEGVVESISVFHTVVVTDEGVYVAVPNGPMWSRSVRNFSRTQPKRVEIELVLERTKTFSEIRVLIEQVLASAVPSFETFPSSIQITDVTTKSIDIAVAFWCDAEKTADLRVQITGQIREVLTAAEIRVIRASSRKKKRSPPKPKSAAPAQAEEEV